MHACNNFSEYNFYLKNDALLLADAFEKFREICLKNYDLDPEKFFSAPRLPWQAALKKAEVKSKLLTDIDMLLTVEKGSLEGLCHAIYDLLYIYDMK